MDVYLTVTRGTRLDAYSKEKRDELNAPLWRRAGALRCRCDGNTHFTLRDDLSRFALQAAYTAGYAWMTYWSAAENWTRPGLHGVSVCAFGHCELFPIAFAAPLASMRYGELRIDGDGGSRYCPRQRKHCVFFARWSPR